MIKMICKVLRMIIIKSHNSNKNKNIVIPNKITITTIIIYNSVMASRAYHKSYHNTCHSHNNNNNKIKNNNTINNHHQPIISSHQRMY